MDLVPKKHRKASIIIVVLIIMMVSSFLVLVTMRYFMHMLSGFTSLTNYYKAYYMARGGMDVLLTQQSNRGWGYELKNTSLAQSFSCADCSITGDIITQFLRIDTSLQPTSALCNAKNAIILSGGQSVIFPLFYDAGDVDFFSFVEGKDDYRPIVDTMNGLIMKIYSDSPLFTGKIYLYNAKQGDFGLIKKGPYSFSQNNVIPDVVGGNEYKTSAIFQGESIQPYDFVIVSNPQQVDEDGKTVDKLPFGICFTNENISSTNTVPMIGLNTILRANARVADSYVTLETIKTNRFPSFLVQ